MRTTTMTPIRRLRCIERSVNRERAGPVKSGGCECAGCTSNRTSVALPHVAHGARTSTAYTPAAAPGCTREEGHEAAVPCNDLRTSARDEPCGRRRGGDRGGPGLLRLA